MAEGGRNVTHGRNSVTLESDKGAAKKQFCIQFSYVLRHAIKEHFSSVDPKNRGIFDLGDNWSMIDCDDEIFTFGYHREFTTPPRAIEMFKMLEVVTCSYLYDVTDWPCPMALDAAGFHMKALFKPDERVMFDPIIDRTINCLKQKMNEPEYRIFGPDDC